MARAVKLDAQLADAVDAAREALTPLVPAGQVGAHLGVTPDADRLVTHRFEAHVPGYRGWEWYVSLGRASRSKVVTVCESGIVPGGDALLAPAWVPWSERMSADELAAAAGGEGQESVPVPDDAAPASAGSDTDAVGQDGDDDAVGDGTDTADAASPDTAAAPDGAEGADDSEDDAEAETGENRTPRRRRRRR